MPDAPVDFLVIGAMKSATTTLYGYLTEHPQLFLCEPKEPDFFVAEQNWRRGIDWYRGLFAAAPAGARRGEASTGYTKAGQFPGVPGRIRQVAPDARLIYLIRDPVARMRSHYIHARLTGAERRPPEQAIVPGSIYLDASLYAFQLDQYLAAGFPIEQLLVVQTEQMGDDPQGLLARVETFIGVEPITHTIGRRDYDSSSRRAHGSVLQAIRRRRATFEWLRRVVPRRVQQRAAGVLTHRFDASDIAITDEILAPLADALAADRAALCQRFPVDVSRWTSLERPLGR